MLYLRLQLCSGKENSRGQRVHMDPFRRQGAGPLWTYRLKLLSPRFNGERQINYGKKYHVLWREKVVSAVANTMACDPKGHFLGTTVMRQAGMF